MSTTEVKAGERPLVDQLAERWGRRDRLAGRDRLIVADMPARVQAIYDAAYEATS